MNITDAARRLFDSFDSLSDDSWYYCIGSELPDELGDVEFLYTLDRSWCRSDYATGGTWEGKKTLVQAQSRLYRYRPPPPETKALNIIFDGPPAPEAGRFVEVETDDGRSVNAGEWTNRPDGMWALRITQLPFTTPAPAMPPCWDCEGETEVCHGGRSGYFVRCKSSKPDHTQGSFHPTPAEAIAAYPRKVNARHD